MVEFGMHEDLVTNAGSGSVGSWWFYGGDYRQ
jgi:hypothetical protein